MPYFPTGGVKTERVKLDPEEQERRIERAVRALRAGVLQSALAERGFSHDEIQKAAKRAKK